MFSQIITHRTQDNYMTRVRDFKTELEAQKEFDVLTKKGNEHEGYLKWDLIVHHPTSGKLCRRTMFTAE